jgi:hypothetical protein
MVVKIPERRALSAVSKLRLGGEEGGEGIEYWMIARSEGEMKRSTSETEVVFPLCCRRR